MQSRAACGDGVVFVCIGVSLRASEARRIAEHELLGHALPRLAARSHPLGLLRVGCARSSDDEEGRALHIEERSGLLDEGRLTDPFGRTHDFRSCLVILTSNLGAATAATPGFTATAEGAAASAGAQVVRRFFRPEFFNRLDAVVAFQPLAAGTLEALLDKELADLEQRAGLRDTMDLEKSRGRRNV